MAELKIKLFDLSTKIVLQLNNGVTDSEKLKLYALFKQSKNGDCNINEPSNFFNPIDHTKWAAWLSLKGKPKFDAMDEYSNLTAKLVDKYGTRK